VRGMPNTRVTHLAPLEGGLRIHRRSYLTAYKRERGVAVQGHVGKTSVDEGVGNGDRSKGFSGGAEQSGA